MDLFLSGVFYERERKLPGMGITVFGSVAEAESFLEEKINTEIADEPATEYLRLAVVAGA